MDEEKMYYNAVAVALDGDPWHIRKIRKKCGNLFGPWRMAYESLAGYEKLIGENGERIKPPDPEAEWEKLEDAGVRLILLGDDDYPTLLREIHHPPLALYVRGTLPAQDAIAIVGTRRGTPDGKAATKRFGRELASAGFAIVSGLALGIDAAAHEGCLETSHDGAGRAIAVLGNGLGSVYPNTNAKLAAKILENNGAIISEYPLDQHPIDYRFLERNRIVSGLAKGILVVEVPQRSGSLATASFALQQNRELFVVPGPISHPNFFGSHQLIRQGAELVTDPSEILEAYGITAEKKSARKENGATPEEKQVLIALRDAGAPLEVDKIIALTKLEPRAVNRAITFLLIKQWIKELDAGYIIE